MVVVVARVACVARAKGSIEERRVYRIGVREQAGRQGVSGNQCKRVAISGSFRMAYVYGCLLK